MKINIFILLLVFQISSSVAQSINSIWIWDRAGLGLDFNNEPPTVKRFGSVHSEVTRSASFCDPSGKLLFYSDGETVWNRDQQVMPNGRLKYKKAAVGNFRNSVAISPVPGFPGRYYLIAPIIDSTLAHSHYFGYVTVDINMDGGRGDILDTVYQPILPTKIITSLLLPHKNERDQWLLLFSQDSMYSILLSITEGITMKQVLSHPCQNYINGMLFTHTHDLKNIIYSYWFAKQYQRIDGVAFDAQSGIADFDKIHRYMDIDSGQSFYKEGIELFGLAVSPNDSIIYALDRGYGNTYPLIVTNTKFRIWQIGSHVRADGTHRINDLYFESSMGPWKRVTYHSIQLGSNGKMYFSTAFFPVMNEIQYPDRWGYECGIKRNSIKLRQDYNTPYLNRDSVVFGYLPTPNIYRRLQYNYRQYCDSLTYFTNISDTVKFTSYIWHFPDAVIMTNPLKVSYNFKKPGVYFVKLEAIAKNGYRYWYSDSVKILSSAFPVKASFETQQQKGCQWIAYHFKDHSQGNLQFYHQYKWDFGDGNDTVITAIAGKGSVSHTYSVSGKFKVSLIFSNKYCSDTAYYSNKVEILSAPKPGIVFPAEAKCSPYMYKPAYSGADPTDSIVYYVTSIHGINRLKEHELAIMNNGGNYKVKQLLYGPSGCITSDSLVLEISSGFTNNNKPSLTNVTMTNNHEVKLAWLSYPGAVSYYLNQNNRRILKTADTIAQIPYTSEIGNNGEKYTVQAINYCDDTSKTSNMGNNIVISGVSEEANEYALLRHNSFQTWANRVDHYELQYLDRLGVWQTEYNHSPTDSMVFKDWNYIATNTNDIQKCYRIKATASGNTSSSISNSICLTYTPALWIPDIFSPNGDGINDMFNVVSTGFEEYTLQIYNRWGELIIETSDPHWHWDGTRQGNKVMEGVYLICINVKSKGALICKTKTLTISY